jgi:hypothetical protein
MENWFVPKGVMVRTGAVCDRAVSATAITIKMRPQIPRIVFRWLLMIFMGFSLLLIFEAGA